MNKQEFIKKWSTWWMLNKQAKELTQAFEKQLDELIEAAIKEASK